MKYSEYRSKPKFKGSVAFYIIIACCLLSVGGAAWFAADSIRSREAEKGKNPEVSISSEPETISLPETTLRPEAEEAAKPVTSEPYKKEEASKPAPTVSRTEPTVFTLPVQGEIIKNYDEKALQYSATYGDMRIHTAVDIACEEGTHVSAAAKGKVLSVEDTAALGKVITVDHGAGITAKYAAIKDPRVKAGDSVDSGDIIGSVTSVPSECADQSHLHLEIYKNGHPASPQSVLGIN